MGVPAFFRWLSTKYPKIITPAIEEQAEVVDGEEIPIDISKPNPNGEEIDNLYLDMNNIIHPCTHPEDRPAPTTEEEMMQEIFRYTQRLVNLVRPRKILMMAIDGVAPRAKMNQQRARRFKAAQDALIESEKKAEFHQMLVASGRAEANSEVAVEKRWDSNQITPGTPFMHKLAQSLRYWVAYNLNHDPAWAKLKVIISDASVPGEGEHKVMEFIRSQRRSPEHDPNTRHCIYGLDADLIMLGLATHEPHFRILREDVFAQDKRQKRCTICNQKGHMADECRGEVKEKQGEFDEKEVVPKKPYLWLSVSVLREYLEMELHVPNFPFKWDLERAIDDYVFLCFFVGNDFLPHLPSLDIKEEGIDNLVDIWRKSLHEMGGWVTTDGHVDLSKAQIILSGLAAREDDIFKRRREMDERKQRRDQQRKQEQAQRDSARSNSQQDRNKKRKTNNGIPLVPDPQFLFDPANADTREVHQAGQSQYNYQKEIFQAKADPNSANKSAAAIIKEQLLKRNAAAQSQDDAASETPATETDANDGDTASGKRKAELLEESAVATPSTPPAKDNADGPLPDDVKMWEAGYADRYYDKKFHVDPKNLSFRRQVAADYVEGVCWVLLYYLQGCPSWTWYYPHHYAPFAADFVDMASMKPTFKVGAPFHPYEQLMGVFPRDSRHAIPKAFHSLMTDEDSPILDFYPTEFDIDLNGKKFSWQGVVLLPFIDEKRLLDAMATKKHLLSDYEVARNEFGQEVLLFSGSHPVHDDVMSAFYSKKSADSTTRLKPKLTDGLCGTVEKIPVFLPNAPLDPPFEDTSLPSLPMDMSLSVYFHMPKSDHIHKSQLLRGVVHPKRVLDGSDAEALRNGRGRGRGRGGFRGGRGGRGGYDNNHNNSRNGFNADNPFAAHLNPGFSQQFMPPGGLPPPPPMPGQAPPAWVLEAIRNGHAPPLPSGFGNGQGGHSQGQQSGGYQGNQGYQGGRGGQQGGYGNQQRGGYGQNNGGQSYRGDRNGGYNNNNYRGDRNGGSRHNDNRGGYDNRRGQRGGGGGGGAYSRR